MARSLVYFDDFLAAIEITKLVPKSYPPAAHSLDNVVQLSPPPSGFYKVNIDATIDAAGLRIGLGIVVRDEVGFVMAAGSQPLYLGVSP
ncbi:hypothetical protein ACOSP7_009620 [Xanthoceras sorbifolium]